MILLDCIDFCISLNCHSCLEFLFDSLMFLYLLVPKNVISCGCFPYDMTEDLSSFILFYVVDFGGCNWLPADSNREQAMNCGRSSTGTRGKHKCSTV